MVHGDDSGLKLPPRIAPIQVAIIPVAQHKEGVLEKSRELKERLKKNFRVKLDETDKMPGWKFSEYEMKGVPLRLEIGPREIENNQVVLVRRDNREKIIVSMDKLETKIQEELDSIHDSKLSAAKAAVKERTTNARTMGQIKDILENKTGFVKAMWCGDAACEEKIKEETGASSRCIPFEQENCPALILTSKGISFFLVQLPGPSLTGNPLTSIG